MLACLSNANPSILYQLKIFLLEEPLKFHSQLNIYYRQVKTDALEFLNIGKWLLLLFSLKSPYHCITTWLDCQW